MGRGRLAATASSSTNQHYSCNRDHALLPTQLRLYVRQALYRSIPQQMYMMHTSTARRDDFVSMVYTTALDTV